MGRLVTGRLVDAGHSVRVFDLPVANYAGLDGAPNVEIVKGDLTNPSDVNSAVEGVDAIAHLAAVLPPHAESNRDLTMKVNVDGTRVVLEAAAGRGGDCRVVLSSSVSVYGSSTVNEELSADSPTDPDDIYAESKALSETLVTESSLPWVALRISGVAVPVFQEPPAAWPFLADQEIEFVHRDDAVSALVASLTRDDVAGRIYNISGGPTWRMTGAKYVADYFNLVEIDPEEAVYQDSPGHFTWYDSAAGQAALGYQNTHYETYLEQVQEDIDRLMAE